MVGFEYLLRTFIKQTRQKLLRTFVVKGYPDGKDEGSSFCNWFFSEQLLHLNLLSGKS